MFRMLLWPHDSHAVYRKEARFARVPDRDGNAWQGYYPRMSNPSYPSNRTVIATDRAPAAIGPYSQAIRAGNLLFLSGQVGLDPETGVVPGETAADQARQVMSNMRAVLNAAGADFGNVVKATIFLADMNDFGAVNDVYGEVMGPEPPARSTVEVSCLPLNVKVEIECIATLDS